MCQETYYWIPWRFSAGRDFLLHVLLEAVFIFHGFDVIAIPHFKFDSLLDGLEGLFHKAGSGDKGGKIAFARTVDSTPLLLQALPISLPDGSRLKQVVLSLVHNFAGIEEIAIGINSGNEGGETGVILEKQQRSIELRHAEDGIALAVVINNAFNQFYIFRIVP